MSERESTPRSRRRRAAPPGRRPGAARWLPPLVALLVLAAVGFLIWYFVFESGSGKSSNAPARPISVSASSVAFGKEDVGRETAPRTITLANRSAAPLGLERIRIRGTSRRDFRLVRSGTCSTEAPLNQDDFCTLRVRFRPRVRGERAARLVVVFNADRGSRTVRLGGTGIGAPKAAVGTTLLDFGRHELGVSGETRTVTLRNTGNVPLALAGVSVEGPDARDFDLNGKQGCAALKRVKAGASCSLPVTFAPRRLGSRKAVLTIAHDAAGSPTRIALHGIGTGRPKADLRPDALTFGNTRVGRRSAPKTVRLTNTGARTLRLARFAVHGGNERNFRVAGGSCSNGKLLAPGASCTIRVRFAPSARGGRRSTLVLTTNVRGSPQRVGLRGRGVRGS